MEAIGAFLEAAKENRLYAYWCVLLFGGLRPSEALALRWEDIRGDTVPVNRVLVEVERREIYFALVAPRPRRDPAPIPASAPGWHPSASSPSRRTSRKKAVTI